MPEITPSKYLVTAGWDDAPHLTEEAKRELLASTPPHLREARSKGIPHLGSGAIYPVPIEDVVVPAFVIPDHWPRSYAMDVGWRVTAAIWVAVDPTDGTAYAYSEHKMGERRPLEHAAAIKARGTWVRGVIDPAAGGRSQSDGRRLIDTYRAQGLDLSKADNSVEAGIHATYEALALGRLKIFETLVQWQDEYRLYRRDERGRIVKEHDHLMDCTRYWVMSGRRVARTRPVRRDDTPWIPADRVAGY